MTERCPTCGQEVIEFNGRNIGVFVQKARALRRISLECAGKEIGCSGNTLSKLEMGKEQVSYKLFLKITKWLGVKIVFESTNEQ